MSFINRLLQRLPGASQRPVKLHKLFQRHQQELQENCISLASASGKPRGLRWKKCDWQDSVTMVENPADGMITLFQGVHLSFEAVEGGDMEGVEAVSMVRDATAVFHYQNQRWGTGGRVLFNMTPEMATTAVAAGQRVILKQPA